MGVDVIFLDGTIYAKSKLDMINDALLAIGESPFIDGTVVDNIPVGTDGETAKRLVEKTMVEVQSRGWYFNTDYDFVLTPDINGFITMPPNTLRVDFGNAGNKHRYTIKNGSIYDYLNKTFIIESELLCDVTWLVDYAELPPEAYEYISLRAARKTQQKLIGSVETDSFTIRDETDSYVNLQRRQAQSQDYNIQNSRVSTRTHNGYLVAGLYGSKGRRNF
jgi:hypothetical protein